MIVIALQRYRSPADGYCAFKVLNGIFYLFPFFPGTDLPAALPGAGFDAEMGRPCAGVFPAVAGVAGARVAVVPEEDGTEGTRAVVSHREIHCERRISNPLLARYKSARGSNLKRALLVVSFRFIIGRR